MLPAQQRLETADLVGVDPFLHLVMQLEFILLDRGLELVRQRAAKPDGVVHLALEEADRALSVAFRAIHRDIGVGQKMRAGRAVIRIDGDADAGADMQGVAVDRERLVEEAREPLREFSRGAGLVGGELNGDEFVAAEAGEEFAVVKGFDHALGRLHQQAVAGAVAEHVVDVLEAVEVHAQDRELGADRLAACDIGRQPLVERNAVRQSGQ